MTRHSNYSPSKLANWEICPGYESEQTETEASKEGTMLHKACETFELIKGNLNEEQLSVVQTCLEYVNPLRKDALYCMKEVRVRVPLLNLGRFSIQPLRSANQKIQPNHIDINPFILSAGEEPFSEDLPWGTADLVIVKKDNCAHVVDYKFGRVAVSDATENLQGWAYALGVFYETKVESVTVHFVQPRRDEVSKHTFKRDAMFSMSARIGSVIDSRKKYLKTKDESLLRTHPDNCLWCAQKATCPALGAQALVVAKNYDVTFELPQEWHPSQIADPSQMRLAYKAAAVLDKWAKSVREHAVKMVQNGQEIPEMRLAERQGTPSIKNAQMAFILAQEIAPELTLEEFVEHAVDVSLPQLKKLIREKSKRGQKEKAEQALAQKLESSGVTVTGQTSYYLKSI